MRLLLHFPSRAPVAGLGTSHSYKLYFTILDIAPIFIQLDVDNNIYNRVMYFRLLSERYEEFNTSHQLKFITVFKAFAVGLTLIPQS